MNSPVNHCTGCTACVPVCQQNAIKMDYDKNGFYVAIIGENCVKCGECTHFCNEIDYIKKVIDRKRKPKTFLAWSKEPASNEIGNSGGLFYTIANYWIENNGVVAAPVYDHEFVPKYSIASKKEEILNQAWSKFVQSQAGDIFPQIREMLVNNIPVLFVGAPCQVKGLYAYLGGDNKNLFTVQFPCIGMPPVWFHQEYLKDLTGCELSDISDYFGEILHGQKRIMKVVLKDGTSVIEDASRSVYTKAWNSFCTISDACCQCADNIAPVCADWTWGNFWYMRPVKQKGQNGHSTIPGKYSMLLVHSTKGEQILRKISPRMSVSEKSYMEACVGHLMFQAPSFRHLIYRKFVKSERRKNFQKAWTSGSFSALKEQFFVLSDESSFRIASRISVGVKRYIWNAIFIIQKMMNFVYAIFRK